MTELMFPYQWKNDHMIAWLNADGTLMVRRRVEDPKEECGHYYLVDALPKIKETEAA